MEIHLHISGYIRHLLTHISMRMSSVVFRKLFLAIYISLGTGGPQLAYELSIIPHESYMNQLEYR